MNLQKIIDELNYEIWELDESTSFYLTDTTSMQYIGIHIWSTDIILWCSEEESFESPNHMYEYLREEVQSVMKKLYKCCKVLKEG